MRFVKFKFIYYYFILLFFFLVILSYPNSVFAISITPPPSSSGLGCGGGFGPIADMLCGLFTEHPNNDNNQGTIAVGNQLNTIVSGLLGFMIIIAGLWFMIQIVTAGYAWISAGGDKTHLETARNKILNALIGLIIVVAAWILTGLVGTLIGLQILNPGALLQNIGL
jgi:hypothetical protein